MEGEGELMKIKYIVSVGSLVAMLSGTVMAGFINDGLNGTPGTSVSGNGWVAPASVIYSNHPNPHSGTAAAIPILQTLTNLTDVAISEMSNTNIWTDFWTIPRPFVSAADTAPTVDPNSSAMFFVTGGVWVVVYGSMGSTTTNSCSTDIFNNNVAAVPNDGTSWRHVSVLHNYNTKTWSLFIEGVPVKTNMVFINNTVSKYDWFSVQNGGGAASNVTWIDDVMVTNRVPETLTHDGDHDGLRDAWELMYYGNLAATSTTVQASGFNNDQLDTLGANPFVVSASEPGGASLTEYVFGDTTNAAFVSAAPPAVGSPNLSLTFQVVSNRLYRVLGSTTYNGAFSDPKFTFVTDASGQTVRTDTGVLASDNTNYYYRLVAETTNGGVVFRETNAITYAVHSQSRVPGASSNFWVGITVDYGVSNRLNSTLGQQLAQGLSYGGPGNGDTLTVYWPSTTVFYLSGPNTWTELYGDNGPLGVSSNIPVGVAMLIQRLSGGTPNGGTRSVFSGPMLTDSSVQVPVVGASWNMISCPYEGSNSIATLTCGVGSADVASADRVWIYRNGQYQQLRRWPTGWQFEPKTGTVPTSTPWGYVRLGEGVFYYNAGSPGTWNP